MAIGDPGVIEVFETMPLRRHETIATEIGAHTLSFDATRNIVCAFLPASHRAAVYQRCPLTDRPRHHAGRSGRKGSSHHDNPSRAPSILAGLLLGALWAAPALAAEPDWKAVEQALGKSGSCRPGDVFRIGMPRTDLSVTVKGVPVKAGFALGSYAAFKQVGDQAMVMGDLVLLDQEIAPA